MNDAKKVFVTGDFVLDHHIYEGRRYHFGDHRNRGVQEKQELGGAALVHYLLTELKGDVDSYLSVEIDKDHLPKLPPGEQVPSEFGAYAIWRPFGPEGEKSVEKLVWRTVDAMGFGTLPEATPTFKWPVVTEPPIQPDVVVISDGGMGFRTERDQWPQDAVLKNTQWIVLKTAQPLVEGDLWQHLTKKYHSKLVVIVSAAELCKSTAQISTGLSWDATVESVITSLASDLEMAALTRCRHLLLTFGTEGGLWLDIKESFGDSQVHFVYDAEAVQGEHRKHGKGTAFGALSCLTAAVACYLVQGEEAPDLETALESGLSAMYDLFKHGHGFSTAIGAGFPAAQLAEVFRRATCRYSRTVFPTSSVLTIPQCDKKPAVKNSNLCWSVIREALRQPEQECPDPAFALAELVAQRGPIALGSLPHLSIGKLMSADRLEIESLRALCRLIREYKDRRASDCKKPLSIGVFGPPGSGKSFAVKQIAHTLLGPEGWMDFNLSQFKPGTEDLIGAFHQIRDRALKNQIPVAFFDEFDSRDYNWLQYLLAPMQDGAFQEGQITHPIGKCVFIFAGGTSETYYSFGPLEGDPEAYTKFKMAKGPDFKSRLDGFLDILGPNQRIIITADENNKNYKRIEDPCDIFYPLRRAFIIRTEFGCHVTDKLNIDNGLLHALLRISKYANGSRSMTKIIEPLKKHYPGIIYRSMLPPRQQLELHVNTEEFLSECHRITPASMEVSLTTDDRERMASAIHETYRRLGREQGWLKKENDVDYSALSPFYRDSNLAAADRMASTLALIGLTLKSSKSNAPGREVIRLKIEYNLELLAEAEHTNWMEWLLDRGWQYGTEKGSAELKKEPEKKTHPCLRPYLELSDTDRNKDRDTIRHYPDFAEKAGMWIVPIENK